MRLCAFMLVLSSFINSAKQTTNFVSRRMFREVNGILENGKNLSHVLPQGHANGTASVVRPRALHYSVKVGNRRKAHEFFAGTLGMKVLRHEEYDSGCAIECNGDFPNAWSKTEFGYGPERQHFAMELIYNYGIKGYKVGNDFREIYIESDDVLKRVEGTGKKDARGLVQLHDPEGRLFVVGPGDCKFPVRKVATNVKDLSSSVEFWHKLLKMDQLVGTKSEALLSFGDDQIFWELHHNGSKIERGDGYGRVAFSYPGAQLEELQERIENDGYKIQHKLRTLDSGGENDMRVFIADDPDDHEICFVGAEGFFERCEVDPNAEKKFFEAIEKEENKTN